MLFRLAMRNILSKPSRAVLTALGIAAAVAMIFSMLSFKPAVYGFMLTAETAISGDSDIVISTTSSSDRVAATGGLVDGEGNILVEGVEEVIPSLTLYATLNDEYVEVRGFAGKEDRAAALTALRDIDVVRGSLDGMRGDDVVISSACAKHFGVDVGDGLKLTLGSRFKNVFVKAVAVGGYFADDSPYLILGCSSGISELIFAGAELCNEIYIKLADGADVQETIDAIRSIEQYSNLLVRRTDDTASVEQNANSLTAPVVLAGAAVMLLATLVVALLFAMSERDKLALVSKLSVIGATKKQIFAIFAIESAAISIAGALLGAGLAVGVFYAMARLTLSATATFAISAGRLVGAVAIGFVAAMASASFPLIRAFRNTIRQNQLDLKKSSPIGIALAVAALTMCAVLCGVLFSGVAGKRIGAILAIVLLALLLAALVLCAPKLLKLFARALSKNSRSVFKVASYNLGREKRHGRGVAILSVGMTISMLLFMAWSLTTSIFTSYLADFENMAFVTNIRADVDVAEFKETEGVKDAIKIVWGEGRLSSPALDRSVTVLGSREALSLVDFEYVTSKDTVLQRLAGEGDYVFVDEVFCELYGIGEGDLLDLELDGETRPVVVGGILSHRLFNGAYVVMSQDAIFRLFGKETDTVVILSNGDIKNTVGALGTKFSQRNYYVIEVLEAFKWDMQSAQAVFDLVGTLAFIVSVFILGVTIASTLVGRTTEEKNRKALLNAGMSKNMLLKEEILEHGAVAILAYILSAIVAAPMTGALIAALALFNLSFEFMFDAGVVLGVGAAMAALYSLTPLIFGYKRGYDIKK